MLTQVCDAERLLDELGLDLVARTILGNFAAWNASENKPPIALADDPARPRAAVFHGGASVHLIAPEGELPVVLADLLEHRVEQEPPWPDKALRADWEKAGKPHLDFGLVNRAVWQCALRVGFDDDPEEEKEDLAQFYYLTGGARLGEWVKHPCRVVERGQELHDLIRQGIDYDKEGEYTRKCLERGPSFVCEVDGEPVCWSATHTGGMMGMIYTPEKHRRRGYARSLAAFQIDYMLRRDGIACALVLDWNEASKRLLDSFGASRLDQPIGWRTVYWPAK
jgi:RimJ/RimL family protein N-acetyltransferase